MLVLVSELDQQFDPSRVDTRPSSRVEVPIDGLVEEDLTRVSVREGAEHLSNQSGPVPLRGPIKLLDQVLYGGCGLTAEVVGHEKAGQDSQRHFLAVDELTDSVGIGGGQSHTVPRGRDGVWKAPPDRLFDESVVDHIAHPEGQEQKLPWVWTKISSTSIFVVSEISSSVLL